MYVYTSPDGDDDALVDTNAPPDLSAEKRCAQRRAARVFSFSDPLLQSANVRS